MSDLNGLQSPGHASPTIQGGGRDVRRQSLLLRLKELPSTIAKKSVWKVTSKDNISGASRSIDEGSTYSAGGGRHEAAKLTSGAETYGQEELLQQAGKQIVTVAPDFVPIVGLTCAEEVTDSKSHGLAIACIYAFLIIFCILIPVGVSISLCVFARRLK